MELSAEGSKTILSRRGIGGVAGGEIAPPPSWGVRAPSVLRLPATTGFPILCLLLKSGTKFIVNGILL